jgi:tellurite resistance protein TerC
MSDYVISAGWWWSLAIVMVAYAIIEAWHMRYDHVVKIKEAVTWTIVYVALGILYAVPLFIIVGSQAGSEYLAAFFTEKALSLDNLFVFALIFAAFKLPKELERRVLNYGVAGAIIFRLVFIFAGIAILHKFEWVSVIFGLILLRAAWHAYMDAIGKSKETDIKHTRSWRTLSKILPLSHHYNGHKLMERVNGKLVFTMMAAVIIMVELTDILFAIDSVPAVLAISTNRFIAYSSNIFALLGLRALYFVYAHVADRFWALKWAISIILGWISIKLILAPFGIHVSHWLNLGVILGVIALAVTLSNVYTRPKKQKPL